MKSNCDQQSKFYTKLSVWNTHACWTPAEDSEQSTTASLVEGIGFLVNADNERIVVLVLLDEVHHLLNSLWDGQALYIGLDPKLFHQLLGRLQIRHGSNDCGWILHPRKETLANTVVLPDSTGLSSVLLSGVSRQVVVLITLPFGRRAHLIPITKPEGSHLDMKWRHTTLTTSQQHPNSNNGKMKNSTTLYKNGCVGCFDENVFLNNFCKATSCQVEGNQPCKTSSNGWMWMDTKFGVKLNMLPTSVKRMANFYLWLIFHLPSSRFTGRTQITWFWQK